MQAISEGKERKKGKSREEGLLQDIAWLTEARARQAGIQRRQREKEARPQEDVDKQQKAQQKIDKSNNIYSVLYSARD